MKIILLVLRQSRALMILSLVIGAVGGLANTGLLVVIHRALSTEPVAAHLLIWSFIGLCLLLPVTRVASYLFFARLTQTAVFELRMLFARQILKSPLRRLEKIGPSRLLANLSGDVGTITQTLVRIPVLCIQLIIFFSCLFYLSWLSWRVAAGSTLFIFAAMSCYHFAVKWAMSFLGMARDFEATLLAHIRSLTGGIKELKLHRPRRQKFFDMLKDTAHQYRRNELIGAYINTTADSVAQFLLFILLMLLIFLVPQIMDISKDTLTGFALTLLYMIVPLDVMASTFPLLGRAKIALDRVRASGLELDAETEIEQETPLEQNSSWGTLDLVGLKHTYHRDDEEGVFSIGPLHLTFRAQQIIFITGGNGSGKTSLAKLLAGLYRPEKGEIRLDGEPITDENRDSFRQLFTVVFWDFFLFDELLGLQSMEIDERARMYLEKLEIDHKVEVRDGRLSTVDLSTGQRKRLALLTAYLEDRPIYLFDEWAADQDPRFRKIFYRQLLPELRARGKTVFVISHDDRFYDVADRVVKLAEGQVDEDSPGTTYHTDVRGKVTPLAAGSP